MNTYKQLLSLTLILTCLGINGFSQCPPDYLFGGNGGLTGTENGTAIYKTDGGIESRQTIGASASVSYDSKIFVTLEPGFNTVPGAEFCTLQDGCNAQCNSIDHGGNNLTVNSALLFDFGTNNNFSNNHYEYFLTLSDGVHNGGNQYIGGTYTINIELLSLGNSFNYGTFQSCFFCGSGTPFSYVGHLFVIEDTNDDDIIDFNSDPFTDGDSGFVEISLNGNITQVEIDFTMSDGRKLEGCFAGQFVVDP